MARDLDWQAIVVVSPECVSPCGACRQFLHEFAPIVPIWFWILVGNEVVGPHVLSDLLPSAMSLARSRTQLLSEQVGFHDWPPLPFRVGICI